MQMVKGKYHNTCRCRKDGQEKEQIEIANRRKIEEHEVDDQA